MSATHDLATLQRGLLGLIKGTHHVTEADEPYLQVVAHSDELALVREIATWWRAFSLERYCVLTVALLKRRGIFDEAVSTFIREHTISPFIETLSRAFLRALSTHADGLVATVAQFELALIQVKHGDPTHYTIEWAYEPYTQCSRGSSPELPGRRRERRDVIAPWSPEITPSSSRYFTSRRELARHIGEVRGVLLELRLGGYPYCQGESVPAYDSTDVKSHCRMAYEQAAER